MSIYFFTISPITDNFIIGVVFRNRGRTPARPVVDGGETVVGVVFRRGRTPARPIVDGGETVVGVGETVVNGGETVVGVGETVSGDEMAGSDDGETGSDDGIYDFGNGVPGTQDGTHGGASPANASPAETVSFVILHNNSRRFWTHIVMK
ncbi:MAG: hypothetical protein FWE57_06785 [Chitinispirillia bacterium]|nr:hypothetical protein [Chitinispirillia bacterium]